MGSVSSSSLLSGGLDVQSIVDQLIEVEREPVRRMESESSSLQSKVTAFQTLNTQVSSFLDRINNILFGGDTVPLALSYAYQDLFRKSVFALRKATSSDEAVLSATGGKGAASGSYAITVSSLAQAKTMASGSLADTNTTEIGTGTLVIQVGSGDAVTIDIDSDNNTLAGIRNAINSADAGVTATIINDGGASPYRLLVTSDETGKANSFTITDNLSGGTGLGLVETQTAEDAEFTVNSIGVKRSSNVVSDVIDGVTLTLKTRTSSAVNVTLESDVDAIVKSLQELATAYNDLNGFYAAQFKYDTKTKTAGVLSGDFTLREIQSRIQGILTQSVSGSFTGLRVLSQVGMTFNNDGSIAVDETKLRNALRSDFEGVAALMLGTDSGVEAAADEGAGIALNLRAALKGIVDPLEGPIHNATDSLNRNISILKERIAEYEARLDIRRELLTSEYSRADQALRLMSVTMSSLNSQLASLTKLT